MKASEIFPKAFISIGYCTLAATLAFCVRVKVQVWVLAPLLEHAPDHMAERPLATLRVTTVLGWNWDTAVVPVGTLKPAGLETMLSPLRPPAVTPRERVVLGAGGLSVSVADRVTPPPATEIVTRVWVETGCVCMLTPPVICPAEISTWLAKLAKAGLLLLICRIWSVLEAAARVTTANEPLCPLVDAGLSEMEAGWACGKTVS